MNKLEKDLQDLFADGAEKVHVLADFDGTLTKEYVQGKKTPSLISVLRDHPGYLSPEYQTMAHELYARYSPIEHDASLDMEFRKAKMVEWWSTHKRLLIDSGIKLEHIQKLAESDFIQWRNGAVDFLGIMKNMGIPVVVLSASGIGEVIPIFCQEKGVKSDNMHFIVNSFIWDEQGRATGFHQPVIHGLNKDETAVKDYEGIFEIVKERVNVLLLGNSMGDLGMAKGFKADKIVTVGFLDKQEAGRVGEFEKSYDHVIVEDGYTKINEILGAILK